MSSNLAEPGTTGTVATEDEKIEAWRFEQLEAAGYSKLHAHQIAARHSGLDQIDLRVAVELVTKKGADPHVAADILL